MLRASLNDHVARRTSLALVVVKWLMVWVANGFRPPGYTMYTELPKISALISTTEEHFALWLDSIVGIHTVQLQ